MIYNYIICITKVPLLKHVTVIAGSSHMNTNHELEFAVFPGYFCMRY